MNILKSCIKKVTFVEDKLRNIYLYAKYISKADLHFKNSQVEGANIVDVGDILGNDMGGHTFFGYYDKSPWSRNGESYLFNHFHSRLLTLYILDLKNSQLYEIAQTQAWNFQQGCMLQWVPNNKNQIVVYNSVCQDKLGVHIYSAQDVSKRFINWPIQALHPNGTDAISLNYYRLKRMNPEYSYKPIVDNFSLNLDPNNDGLWKINLFTKRSDLIVNLKELLNYKIRNCMGNASHGLNHVVYSPSGNKFIFIHRWVTKNNLRFSRLYVVNEDGSDFRLLMDDDYVSHYCWIDDHKILTYAGTHEYGKRFYIVDLSSGEYYIEGQDLLDKYGDGHPSLSPDNKWIAIDTYPGPDRVRRLNLWSLEEKRLIEIGKFYSPIKYERYNRCDLHPRWHPSEPLISIDSTHTGIRRNYIVDVRKITGDFK
jgi:hypothetical protein